MTVNEQPESPTEEYGAMLKRARDAAHLSQAALGEVLSCSESLVGLIERGKRRPTKKFTLAAEAALGLKGDLYRLLPNTTVMATEKWFSEWPGVETKADTIRTWEPLVVPGLLQTPRYAQVLFAAEPGVTEQWREEALATRIQRQSVFQRKDPLMYWVLIDESVLLRPVGGKEVIREQLEHLLKMAEQPNISIQVVPLDVGATAGLVGGFAIAQGEGMRDHVYLEDAAVAGTVSAREEMVRRVRLRYDAIHKWAHPVHVSQRLLREVAATYEDQ
ncbi:Scr1 family TA system antitoxin-like transcriptional regulator [Nonomuraea sp. M3C6]|uniref:Scr1 family TA system antitoxin-like transcriptional regulator n=1 Tax=Nonomuraea marmarensis TaxID=3351344 RepID=A0ABW7AFA7_9ACTN